MMGFIYAKMFILHTGLISEEDIKKYREISGDSTSKIAIVDESDAALREKLLGGDFKYVKKILKKAERETGKQKEDI